MGFPISLRSQSQPSEISIDQFETALAENNDVSKAKKFRKLEYLINKPTLNQKAMDYLENGMSKSLGCDFMKALGKLKQKSPTDHKKVTATFYLLVEELSKKLEEIRQRKKAEKKAKEDEKRVKRASAINNQDWSITKETITEARNLSRYNRGF